MAKKFASQGDMSDKTISFTEIGRDLWAFTAEGDPNTGVIIGDDSVMVIDAQATPRLADMVVEKIRTVSDKPIKHVVLSHYHAVRVLGASAYDAVILGHQLEDSEAEDASADVRALPSTAAMTPILRLVPELDAPLRVNAMETQVRSPVSADVLMDGLKQALANDPIANAQLYRIA